MKHSLVSRLAISLIALTVIGLFATPAQAALIATGDVSPANPATWTNTTDPKIGDTLYGHLQIDNGSDLLSDRVHMGYDSNAVGEVYLDGIGSTWNVDSSHFVGYEGEATLDISGGGKLTSDEVRAAYLPGSKATMRVRGTGSTWTHLDSTSFGREGEATLEITEGGRVIGTRFTIGHSTGSKSIVTVDGDQSLLQSNNNISIGTHEGSEGTLKVQNGGDIISRDLTLGLVGALGVVGGKATMTLDGLGSTVDNSGKIGLYHGSITVTNGATVESSSARLYNSAFLTLDGAGTSWKNTSYFDISGPIEITGGATLEQGSSLVAIPPKLRQSSASTGRGRPGKLTGAISI